VKIRFVCLRLKEIYVRELFRLDFYFDWQARERLDMNIQLSIEIVLEAIENKRKKNEIFFLHSENSYFYLTLY